MNGLGWTAYQELLEGGGVGGGGVKARHTHGEGGDLGTDIKYTTATKFLGHF